MLRIKQTVDAISFNPSGNWKRKWKLEKEKVNEKKKGKLKGKGKRGGKRERKQKEKGKGNLYAGGRGIRPCLNTLGESHEDELV